MPNVKVEPDIEWALAASQNVPEAEICHCAGCGYHAAKLLEARAVEAESWHTGLCNRKTCIHTERAAELRRKAKEVIDGKA